MRAIDKTLATLRARTMLLHAGGALSPGASAAGTLGEGGRAYPYKTTAASDAVKEIISTG